MFRNKTVWRFLFAICICLVFAIASRFLEIDMGFSGTKSDCSWGTLIVCLKQREDFSPLAKESLRGGLEPTEAAIAWHAWMILCTWALFFGVNAIREMVILMQIGLSDEGSVLKNKTLFGWLSDLAQSIIAFIFPFLLLVKVILALLAVIVAGLLFVIGVPLVMFIWGVTLAGLIPVILWLSDNWKKETPEKEKEELMLGILILLDIFVTLFVLGGGLFNGIYLLISLVFYSWLIFEILSDVIDRPEKGS